MLPVLVFVFLHFNPQLAVNESRDSATIVAAAYECDTSEYGGRVETVCTNVGVGKDGE